MMSITTNPALRKMLQEKYEEENALAKEEADRPEKVKEMVLEAQTEAVHKEEIEKLTAEIIIAVIAHPGQRIVIP